MKASSLTVEVFQHRRHFDQRHVELLDEVHRLLRQRTRPSTDSSTRSSLSYWWGIDVLPSVRVPLFLRPTIGQTGHGTVQAEVAATGGGGIGWLTGAGGTQQQAPASCAHPRDYGSLVGQRLLRLGCQICGAGEPWRTGQRTRSPCNDEKSAEYANKAAREGLWSRRKLLYRRSRRHDGFNAANQHHQRWNAGIVAAMTVKRRKQPGCRPDSPQILCRNHRRVL